MHVYTQTHTSRTLVMYQNDEINVEIELSLHADIW